MAGLQKFAWLSIAAALATMGLKAGAYALTGSVGLLSDALESVVNLVAAIAALIALSVAAKEPDEEHAYGHTKAEYFSSGLEGALIFVAAVGIVWSAVPRLVDPRPLEQLGAGLGISVVASVINGAVAWRLLRAGTEFRSIALQADGRHLLTDVWTSVGVLAGVGLVWLTGWDWLDPIVALAVALNILRTGWLLIRSSILGLLDTILPAEDLAIIERVLARYRGEHGVETRELRTRQAGRLRFVSLSVLVPGAWTVERGHQLVDELEQEIQAALPETSVITHLEPLPGPAAPDDAQAGR